MTRVYIPYFCIGVSYFFWKYIIVQTDIAKFFSFIFPVSFWIYGNIEGMWYIDIILAFYLIFPFLYKCIDSKKSKSITILFIVLAVWMNVFLYYYDRVYYELIAIGISKVPLLVFGIYVGKCSYEKMKIKWKNLLLVSIMWFSAYIFVPKEFMWYTWLCDIRSVLGCLYLVIILDLIKKKYINDILSFFGVITLELYLLHLFIGDVLSTYHVWENNMLRYCITIVLSVIIACFFSGIYRKKLRK